MRGSASSAALRPGAKKLQTSLSTSGLSGRLSRSTKLPNKLSQSQSSCGRARDGETHCKVCERPIAELGGFCVFQFEAETRAGKRKYSIRCLQHFANWATASSKTLLMQWHPRSREFRPVPQLAPRDPVFAAAFQQLRAIVGPTRATEPGILLDTHEASPACALCHTSVEGERHIWFCLDCNRPLPAEELSLPPPPEAQHPRQATEDIFESSFASQEPSGTASICCFSARSPGAKPSPAPPGPLTDRAGDNQWSSQQMGALTEPDGGGGTALFLLCHKHFLATEHLHDPGHLMVYLQHDPSQDRLWNPLPYLARQSGVLGRARAVCAVCRGPITGNTRWNCLECGPRSPFEPTFDLCDRHFRALHLQAKLHDVNHLMRRLVRAEDGCWREELKVAPKRLQSQLLLRECAVCGRSLQQARVALVCSGPGDSPPIALCPMDFVNAFADPEEAPSHVALQQFNPANRRWYTTISKDSLLLHFETLDALLREMKALPLVDFFLAESAAQLESGGGARSERLWVCFCKIGDTVYLNKGVLAKESEGYSLFRTMAKLAFSTFFEPDLGSKFLEASICRVCGQRFRASQPRFYCTHVECNTQKFLPYELCQLHFYTHVRQSPSSLALPARNAAHKPWHPMAELAYHSARRRWEVVGLVTQLKFRKSRSPPIKTDSPGAGADNASSTLSSPIHPASPPFSPPATASREMGVLGVSPLRASDPGTNTFFSSQSQELVLLGSASTQGAELCEYPCVSCGRDLQKIGHCLRATPDSPEVQAYAEYQCLQCYAQGPHPYMGPPFTVALLRTELRREWEEVLRLPPEQLEKMQNLLRSQVGARRACELCQSPLSSEKWLCLAPGCIGRAICERHFLSEGRGGEAHPMLALRWCQEEGLWEVGALAHDSCHERECALRCSLCRKPLVGEKLYWRCNECSHNGGEPYLLCHADFFEMNTGGAHSIYHKMAKFLRDSASTWALKGQPEDQASYFNAAIDMGAAEEELRFSQGRPRPHSEAAAGSFLDTQGFESFLRAQDHRPRAAEPVVPPIWTEPPSFDTAPINTHNSLDELSNKSVKESALESRGDQDFEEDDLFPPLHAVPYLGQGKLSVLHTDEDPPLPPVRSPSDGEVSLRKLEEKSMAQRTVLEWMLEKEANKSRPGLISKCTAKQQARAPTPGSSPHGTIVSYGYERRCCLVWRWGRWARCFRFARWAGRTTNQQNE